MKMQHKIENFVPPYMGVPSLYKWLTLRYPEIKEQLDKKEPNLADVLYLDFNAIIHPCCNKTLENMQDTDSELYKNLENFLDEAIEKVRPRQLLYISIDGVAPRAKLNQQRARRFTHAKEVLDEGKSYFKDDCGAIPLLKLKEKIADSENNSLLEDLSIELADFPETCSNGVFDTNSITPGTEFMQRLDSFVQELISYKISSDDKWANLSVIFSGFRTPGEGEQKIMEYIRKHQNKKQSAIIYSPDADLIFLGLSLFDHKIKILREEPKLRGEEDNKQRIFTLVDIAKLRNLLIKQFKGAIKITFDHRRFLEDWVLLCFSVGNDFLPCSPCFEIRANALDKLTQILQNVFLKTRSFITDNGKINYHILREFFVECAKRENDFIVEKRNNLIRTRQRMNLPFEQSDEFYLDNERGKIRFYVEKMNIKSENELTIACKEYIRGLYWVYSYYFYDIPSWDWYYPYHFAPFMADLASVKEFTTTFETGRPLKPLEQLLNVLPPLSEDLLPECLRPIFTQFKEYYPTEFKLDMFQKCMDWQAVPILPFMNSQDIVKAFEQKQSLLSFAEAERNIPGYPLFYSRQAKLIAKIYPMYTELRTSDSINIDEYVGKVYTTPKFRAIEEEVNLYGFKYVNRAISFSFDQRKNTKNINK